MIGTIYFVYADLRSCLKTAVTRCSRYLQTAPRSQRPPPVVFFDFGRVYYCDILFKPCSIGLIQVFSEGGVDNSSNITQFTNPYAATLPLCNYAVLTSATDLVVTTQAHGDPRLPLPHQPPGGQLALGKGRLGRPPPFLDTLGELSAELCRPSRGGCTRSST